MTRTDELLRARLAAVPAWDDVALPRAAVLCPLVVHADQDHVLLVVRPTTLRRHGGQVGFPGGMREPDESVLATALRELHEELGVLPDAVDVLGALPPRTSSTGIRVHPVVARLAPVALRPDPAEVARVLHAPLELLRDDARWSERAAPAGAPGAQPLVSPHFELDGALLWGLTARFVRDLLAALRAE